MPALPPVTGFDVEPAEQARARIASTNAQEAGRKWRPLGMVST
jgi:hypothetical protein